MKGQGIYAYVSLKEGTKYEDKLKKELIQTVREQIGEQLSPRLCLSLFLCYLSQRCLPAAPCVLHQHCEALSTVSC